ncbi:hypothetical protein [Desulfogranum marinum]|uniref:hypothetical protein n=1 Tax=Desulfogranum marinum TaxID=453220 RepID=UPI0019658B65|nr:hypothetical protein [Desulfogranum marinum]MBM9515212.1 hypothetical protein [Desulfogranum marinum]
MNISTIESYLFLLKQLINTELVESAIERGDSQAVDLLTCFIDRLNERQELIQCVEMEQYYSSVA